MENIAAQRYARTLAGAYRYCHKHERSKCKTVSEKLNSVRLESGSLGKKLNMSVFMITHFPGVYCALYSVYDKLRKPNWGVN